MKNFVIFFNKNGNKKLAVELGDGLAMNNEKLTLFFNAICNKNDYSFMFKQILSIKEELKNIPVIPIAEL